MLFLMPQKDEVLPCVQLGGKEKGVSKLSFKFDLITARKQMYTLI